jgi:hypothetical protein
VASVYTLNSSSLFPEVLERSVCSLRTKWQLLPNSLWLCFCSHEVIGIHGMLVMPFFRRICHSISGHQHQVRGRNTDITMISLLIVSLMEMRLTVNRDTEQKRL